MRKYLLTSLTALFLATAGCQPPDPNTFEAHLPGMRDASLRAASMTGLAQLTKAISTADNVERKKEFGEKVTPVFAELWEEAKEHRIAMLEMMRDMGQATPAAVEVWSKAVMLDGTTEARQGALIALQGIRSAQASGAAEAVRKAFDSVVENPANDTGENTGEVRLEYVKTLGELRDAGAVDVLLKSLSQTADQQPVAVHKQVVEALASIGASDPKVIDALLSVQFRVPDAPGTQSIGERAARALAIIGAPAVPRVIDMMSGKIEEVNHLAAEHEVDLLVTHQLAVKILGAIGHESAVEALVAFMPTEDCKEPDPKAKKAPVSAEEMDAANIGLRAVIARSLGEIGSDKAVDALCGCRNATHNPGDLWEITMAMGRIGGPKAFECLADVVANNEYNPDELPNSDFRYEIRWEGARFMILAGAPADAAKMREVIAAQSDPKVKENIVKWEPGLATLEKCKDDKACYKEVLTDPAADWFAREVAATQYARMSMGDAAAAQDIAMAFKVRDPEARVTMALLTERVMQDAPCPACADAIEAVMESEQGSAAPEMQAAWLTGRQAIGKLRRGAKPGEAAPAPAPAAPAEPAAPAASGAGG